MCYLKNTWKSTSKNISALRITLTKRGKGHISLFHSVNKYFLRVRHALGTFVSAADTDTNPCIRGASVLPSLFNSSVHLTCMLNLEDILIQLKFLK